MNPLDAAIIRIARLEEELAHVRANHAEMVARNSILRARNDIPIWMTDAYRAIENDITAVHEARHALRRWAEHQGHDRCWWHPDILCVLATILGVSIPEPRLPPREEFRTACARYETAQYEQHKEPG